MNRAEMLALAAKVEGPSFAEIEEQWFWARNQALNCTITDPADLIEEIRSFVSGCFSAGPAERQALYARAAAAYLVRLAALRARAEEVGDER